MRVLVTGATGSIGPDLVRRLAPGNEAFAISRHVDPELDRVEWIRQDVSRPLDHAALPGQVDVVAHLAQSERYGDFPDGATDLFAVNVQSTASLLEYARGAGAGAFVLASTGGCYAPSPEPIGEDALLSTSEPTLSSLIPEPARNG